MVVSWNSSFVSVSINEAGHILKRDLVTLNIDHQQMGVGGDTGWGERARAHPEYRLPAQEYSYGFRIRPFLSDRETQEALRKQKFKDRT